MDALQVQTYTWLLCNEWPAVQCAWCTLPTPSPNPPHCHLAPSRETLLLTRQRETLFPPLCSDCLTFLQCNMRTAHCKQPLQPPHCHRAPDTFTHLLLIAWPPRSAMRVLHAASYIPGVNVVLRALGKLVPTLTNVLWVGLLFYYIFAVSHGFSRPLLLNGDGVF